MNLIDIFEVIWVAIQLTLYSIFGAGPVVLGIYMIYTSQTDFFTREYQESMYLGLGIVSLVLGLLGAWACLVRGVELYRSYSKSVE